MEINNQKGQTVVEYILLLTVAVSLVMTFYKSATFQRFFGTGGELGQIYKVEAEWGYRHASMTDRGAESEGNEVKSSVEEHASYYNAGQSQSHFFSPTDKYP